MGTVQDCLFNTLRKFVISLILVFFKLFSVLIQERFAQLKIFKLTFKTNF